MLRQSLIMLAVGFSTIGVSSRPAFADTKITEPASAPHQIEFDAANAPKPFTVTASGFPAGSLVYVEQCDGKAPTSENWRPTLNCDAGSSPAAAIVDDNGIATFPVDDRNKAFHPFIGESPQQLFNCVPQGEKPPANDLATFSNCKIRVSSNNFNSTADQVFLEFALSTSSTPTNADDSSSAVPVFLAIAGGAVLILGAWWLVRKRRDSADTAEERRDKAPVSS